MSGEEQDEELARLTGLVHEDGSRKMRRERLYDHIVWLAREDDLDSLLDTLIADGLLKIETVRSLATSLMACCRRGDRIDAEGDQDAAAKAAAKRTADKYF